MNPNLVLLPYTDIFAEEVNFLWRLSFDNALAINKRSERDSVDDQLHYLRHHLSKVAAITISFDTSIEKIAGFVAFTDDEIEQLYIHPEYQKQGVGRQLVNLAKRNSNGSLVLHTFQQNHGARKFYQAMGFVEIKRGQANWDDNPWAHNEDQLADITYRWTCILS